MNMDEIRRLLSETVAWCHQHASDADPADSLRTRVLRPTNLGTVADKWGDYHYEWGTGEQNQAVVATLAQRRAELLRADDNYPEIVTRDWEKGRLLIASPLQSDICCLSGPESNGFIDAEDVPPWDTWLYYIGEPTLPDVEQTHKTLERLRAEAGYVSGFGPWRKVHQGVVNWQPPTSVSYILCWIPQQFLGLAEDGIKVNPVDCFFWAVDYKQRHYNTRLMQQLDAAGLLR